MKSRRPDKMKPILYDLPRRKPGYVYSVDMHQWDFQQQNIKIGHHLNGNTHPADKKDLLLTKKGVNYPKLRDSSLFTIGGYAHFHDGTEDGIFIEDGALTQQRLGSHHINCINFEEVGGIVKPYRLTKENIIASDVKEEYWRSVFIHVPEADFGHHLVGLSICGEIYWLSVDGKILSYINNNTLKFDFIRWHLYEKIYRYKDLFGRRHMGLTPYQDNRISTEEVKKKEFIQSLFTLPQSFVIVVETPKPLEITKQLVDSHQLPKRYFVGDHHYAPLRSSDGRYLPYIPMEDRNGVVLCTEENRWYPQQNDQIIRSQQPYLNELNVSTRRAVIRQAHFINMKFKE